MRKFFYFNHLTLLSGSQSYLQARLNPLAIKLAEAIMAGPPPAKPPGVCIAETNAN